MSDVEPQADGHKLPTIRGPRLDLEPHAQSCDLSELRSLAKKCRRPIAIDLFCGGGGLSLGLQRAGFDVILGVDKDPFAVQTHRAHFAGASVQKTLAGARSIQPIIRALKGIDVSLIAGGPPCQPFSMPVRWRRAGAAGADADTRRELWVPFLHAVTRLRPKAVLMENVPDLARHADGVILRKIIERLVQLGYMVAASTFPAYHFGVPQFRSRLFVVGLRRPAGFDWPTACRNADGTIASLRDAIDDLPPVEAGWNSVPGLYEGPRSDLQKMLRANLPLSAGIWDHVTRAVRRDDLEAFQLMDSTTRYPDLPSHLKRYDDEHFTDKYNRLAWDRPSRAITAHLARDGYWYIHPQQNRTLTIREAARIQSFPDWFRFAGFASSALRQIGEAVAPLVAEGMGKAILEALRAKDRRERNLTFVSPTNFPRPKLEAWFEKDPINNSSAPWRRTGNLWLVLLGEVLMADLAVRTRRLFWKNLETAWQTPRQYLKDRNRTYKARAIGCHDLVAPLDKLATLLTKRKMVRPEELLFLDAMKVKLAFSLCGHAFDRPNVRSVVRVARRYFNQSGEDDDSASRQILIGMLIGEDKHGEAFAAAMELGERLCTATEPACLLCPLHADCGFALAGLAGKTNEGRQHSRH